MTLPPIKHGPARTRQQATLTFLARAVVIWALVTLLAVSGLGVYAICNVVFN
jgi:hypothetical protein